MILLFLIVVFVSFLAYVFDREITFPEFLGMFSITFIVVGLVYSLQFIPFSNSVYFQSGRLVKVGYYPKFVEQYKQEHEICTSSGKTTSCRVYYTTERATHPEHWAVFDSFGRSWDVDKNFYHRVYKDFKPTKTEVVSGMRCTHGGHRISGDSNSYLSYNDSNTYEYPVSVQSGWHNPIVGTKSLFNAESDIEFPYPTTDGYFYNKRLMTASGLTFSSKEWDIFNTKLYEKSGANANLFSVKDHKDCSAVEAKWTGGGKNDFNICVVGSYKKPEYVKIFGWSSDLYGMKEAESYILDKGITKDSLDGLLVILERSYIETDFSQFDYIKRPCPLWINILAIIAAIISCIVSYMSFNQNDYGKN